MRNLPAHLRLFAEDDAFLGWLASLAAHFGAQDAGGGSRDDSGQPDCVRGNVAVG